MPDSSCALHRVHHPSVARYFTLTIGDHAVQVCPTGLANVMAYKDYLRGLSKPLLVKVGPDTKLLAQQIVSHEDRTGEPVSFPQNISQTADA